MHKTTIFLCGGGTGGHFFPLIEIKRGLENNLKNSQFFYIGSLKGIEKTKAYENFDDSFMLLNVYGFKRKINLTNILENFLLIPLVIVGFCRVLMKFRKQNPKLLIASGGYASLIPLMVAKMTHTPYYIQEQNSYPGIVTRLFYKSAKKVFLGFESAEKYLDNSFNILVTGNPTRFQIIDVDKNQKNSKQTIMIFGGSQGSQKINLTIEEMIINSGFKNFELFWIVGKNNFNEFKKYNSSSIKVYSFVDNIEELYLRTDLIISRAGAMTISEIVDFQLPSILIPLPSAAENHQYFNAKYLEEKNCSMIINEEKLNSDILANKINTIFSNERIIQSMKNNFSTLTKRNSVKLIIDSLIEDLNA